MFVCWFGWLGFSLVLFVPSLLVRLSPWAWILPHVFEHAFESLQKLWARHSETTDSIFALRIYPSVYLLFLILFVCPLMYRFAHLHLSTYPPTASFVNRQAELDRIRKEHLQIAQEQVGSESKTRAGAFYVHNGTELQGLLKTTQAEELEGERRRLQEQTRVLMWAPQKSKFRSLKHHGFSKNHVLFVVSWVPCHLGRVLSQLRFQIWCDILRNDEECDPKTRSEWQTCCLFSYMEVILTRTLHLPLLFFQDVSRAKGCCISGAARKGSYEQGPKLGFTKVKFH